MSTKKRGQVSIFMVLAVVILVISFIYFQIQLAEDREAELADAKLSPLQTYVNLCIDQVAQDALDLLGAQAGYIHVPEDILRNPNAHIEVGPETSVQLPLWWYQGSERIPTLESMTTELEQYMMENFEACINNFEPFQNQFDVVVLGELSSEVTINEQDVTFDVHYPVDLRNKLNSSVIELNNFKRTVPVRLKKMYEAALDILAAENRDKFLEAKTLDLIAMDEAIPTTDLEATCKEKVWRVQDVEQKLKKLLRVNLPYINIVSTDYSETIYVPNPFGVSTYGNSYFNTHYTWKLTDKSYKGFRAAFSYEERWPFYFYTRPSSGGLMRSRPQFSQDLLSFLCIHIWHFTYDVRYPVRVALLEDDPNFNDFQFIVGLEVSIQNNQAQRDNYIASLRELPQRGDTEEFCNDLAYEQIVYTENLQQDPVADINLSFTCGVFTCDIGEADWFSFGAAAGLRTAFPYCVNGILKGKGEGYEDAKMFIQTNAVGTHTLQLTPIKELEVEVIKENLDTGQTSRMDPGDTVVIRLKSTSSEYEATAVVVENEPFPFEMRAIDDTYEVTAHLTDDEKLIGGYQGTWQVRGSDVLNANFIRFHVVEKSGSDEEQFIFISDLETHAQAVPKPELI